MMTLRLEIAGMGPVLWISAGLPVAGMVSYVSGPR